MNAITADLDVKQRVGPGKGLDMRARRRAHKLCKRVRADPLPCPDPAPRAVRMALAMRERVGELAETWQKRGHRLDFGVGIALGYVTLGRIGFEGRFDYGAIGAVTNLDARLCDEARGGQILISQRVYAEVEEQVEAEPLGDFTLKGFRRPVTSFNVLRQKVETRSRG